MRRRTLSMAVAGILAPTFGYALGLGEISTNSALNQPLDADIQLVSAAAGEMSKVTVRLAPDSVFDQVGITRSGLLDQLSFEPTTVNGATIIKVTSQRPIQEPFINFVIEVSWPKGKLLREYTVLLDPPVLGDPVSPVRTAAAPAQPVADTQTSMEPAAETQSASAGADEGLAPFVGGAAVESFPIVAAEPVEADIPIAETVAIADTVSDAVPETETFSVAETVAEEVVDEGSSDIFVSESEPLETTEVVVADDTVAEVEVAEAETFAVTDVAVSETQGIDDSEGTSDIFVSQAAATPVADAEPAETEIAEAETFAVAPDELAQADDAVVAELESETFSVVDAEPVTDAQQLAPGEGTSEIFVSVPDYQQSTVVSETSTTFGDDEYYVNRGDTLFSISKNSRPHDDLTITQMMAAFLRENPNAFVNGDINKMKAGFILRVPDETTVAQASHAEAIRELKGHGGEAFQQYRSKLAEAAVPQQAAEGAAVAGIEDLISGTPAVEAQEVEEPAEEVQKVEEAAEAIAGAEEKQALEILVPEDKGQIAAETQLANAAAIESLEKEVALAREQLESKSEETAELESRVAELEGIVSAKERLIQLKEDELSDLQQRLSAGAVTVQPIEEVAEEAVATEEEVAETVADQPAEIAVPPVGALEAEEIAEAKIEAERADLEAEEPVVEEPVVEEPVVEEPVVEEPVVEEPVAEEPVAEEPVVEEVVATEPALAETEEVVSDSASASNPNLLMGAGVGALLLSMLAWLVFRKKSPQEEPVLVDEDMNASVETVISEVDKPLYSDGEHEVSMDAPEGTIESSIAEAEFTDSIEDVVAEELSVDEATVSVEDEAEIVAAMTAELAADDLDFDLDVEPDLSATGEVDGLEDEVLSEANVYLAYGLHDQAIELLKPAVEAHPDRTNYSSKLLEAYHATGDKDSFAEVAAGLRDKVGADSSNPIWQRAVVMGKDLIPDHELFANADPGDLTLTAIQNQRTELTDLDMDDGPLTELGDETLSLNSEDIESGFDIEQDPVGEFELPDLDELSQSLQMDGDEITAAFQDSETDLSQEVQADLTGQLEDFKPDFDRTMALSDDDANLTLADVENELTSLTTGADEMNTKLDLAKAYLDMGDDEGAREALEEVIAQGDETQSGAAKKLMDQIG